MTMIVARKIRLIPTKEQEIMFLKSAGTARWAYNLFLSENELLYNQTGKSLKESDLRKHVTQIKKTTHKWLKEISANVVKQAIKDADKARWKYINGQSGKPKYKSKHRSKPSFYVNYESLKRTNTGFKGEVIGEIKTSEPLPNLKKGEKYSNPRISFDGRNWFLSIGYKIKCKPQKLTNVSLGIDAGIKELAVCSDGKFYGNINKTSEVKRLEKKLKRQSRKLSRKLLANTKSYAKNRKPIYKTPLKEMKNIQKQNKVINKLHKTLTDIRNNYLHQTSNEIVKTKPSRIVMETLNIQGMRKNKHLAKAISDQKLFEFKRQIKYKCQKYCIEFVEVDMFFPSSKLCSKCGNKKVDLKLKDRVYKCECCGFEIDRDLNASINLSTY